MRVSLRRFALALSLPAITAAPAFAEQYYYDDGQPPAAIALFSGQGFTGDVREAFDPFASMHDMAFNDRARSVAVLAGQWELCEHHNFTGRCVFIREDVPDLGWFGLNNQVSSIRPIFEYTEAQHGLMFSRDDYGYIRYAHNESYGHGHWNYGYASSVRISVQHYGYSPDYWRFGYYDPRWGYDPYGFAWSPFGGPRYVSYVYRVHPRPVIINNYWKKNWSSNHKHWSRRGHRDDWRRSVDWRGSNDGRGRGGSSSRDDRGRDDRGRGGSDGRSRGTDWNRDDRGRGGNDGRWAGGGGRDGNRDGTSRGGNRSGQDSVRRTDERDLARTPGQRGPRGDGQRTDGRGPARADSGVIPADPRRGSGSWQGNRSGDTSTGGVPRGDGQRRGGGERPASSFTPPSTPQTIASPSPRLSAPGGASSPQRDRPNRDGNRGDGGRRGGDTLLGAPGGAPAAASTPRGGGRDGARSGGGQGSGSWRGDSGRGGGGGSSGTGRGSSPSPAPAAAPAARPSAPPQTAVSRPSPPPRVEGGRGGRGGGDGGGRGNRRSGSSQD